MLDGRIFFDGWAGVARTVVLALTGYGALVLMLRMSRKRTLAQMNVFDFLYVVLMGDVLAVTIMDENVALIEGLAALGVLIALQVLISWMTTHSSSLEHVINGRPTLLMRRGRLLRDAMDSQRVTEGEVLAAVREEGVADLEQVEAVVLETNGAFSVVHFGGPADSSTGSSALRDVAGVEPGGRRDERRRRDRRGSAASAVH